jgi:predicted HAD superfamily Cof-like phosphohydrolase
MQLAEALIERADIQKRAEQLVQRLRMNAKTQEGEAPAEDPATLLTELLGDYDRLGVLIARIHRSNMAARLPDGRTLTDALAHREVLDLRLTALLISA